MKQAIVYFRQLHYLKQCWSVFLWLAYQRNLVLKVDSRVRNSAVLFPVTGSVPRGRSASDASLNVVIHERVTVVPSMKTTTSFDVLGSAIGSAGGLKNWLWAVFTATTSHESWEIKTM